MAFLGTVCYTYPNYTDGGNGYMSTPTGGHKKIRTIVITGGPCGGKTTAMSWLQNALTSAGYAVIFLTETFTELANGGISSYNCKDNFAFQRIQVRYQLERERLYRRAAEALSNDNVVIVHDRGSMDDKPYMTAEEFASILEELGQDEVSFRDKYDAVFHLVTAAKGALPFYTTANNTARTETPEEAIDLDEKTLAAWAGHPHLRIIDNSTDFNGKMLRLLKEVMAALGEPEPMEHARRFLIKYPDLDWLNNNHRRQLHLLQDHPAGRPRRRAHGGGGALEPGGVFLPAHGGGPRLPAHPQDQVLFGGRRAVLRGGSVSQLEGRGYAPDRALRSRRGGPYPGESARYSRSDG